MLDACSDGGLPAEIVAVGADRVTAAGLSRANDVGIPTFVVSPGAFANREHWDQALAEQIASYQPTWVVSAGFMRILGAAVLTAFPNRIINTHPALLPSFPGSHAVADALTYGVKVTGCTVHVVDQGVDTGPVLAQQGVTVEPGDTEESLHERIKSVEHQLLVQVVGQLCRHEVQVVGREVILT
ncbi:MAG: phosphoribosylglycinamide formyltransferase-1 [Actinomycetes bacterium]